MKKLFLILFVLTIGCSPLSNFKTERLKTNEIFGAGYEHLDGKLFSIYCDGYADFSYDSVKKSCLQETAKFVHDKGYQYFSVVSKDENRTAYSGAYVSGGMYIPYVSTAHSQSYIILFITKEERSKYSNFYKVSDYYTDK